MDRRHVTFNARAKAANGKGRFDAIVSAYDRPYAVGEVDKEVVRYGAFRDAPDAVPVYHQHAHELGQPPIGVTTRTTETPQGLKASGELFLDTENGRSAFRAMEAGALREWSIGFLPKPDGAVADENGTIQITDAELVEVSAVLLGANPGTETVSIRAARAAGLPEPMVEALRAAARVYGTVEDAHLHLLTKSRTYRSIWRRLRS